MLKNYQLVIFKDHHGSCRKLRVPGWLFAGLMLLLTGLVAADLLLARYFYNYKRMDGAGKFVSGDVAATIIITAINIAGGFFIGVLQKGMLRHFAELSGLVCLEVNDPAEFTQLAASAATGDAVFVDTPSFRREGEAEAWCREMGISGQPGLTGHLLLSPLFSPTQTAHFLRAHRCQPLESCIWTKLDEACSYGSLVNVAHASSLPVSALTFGPELTQGLAPASAKAVWKLLFKHQLPGEYPDTSDAGV